MFFYCETKQEGTGRISRAKTLKKSPSRVTDRQCRLRQMGINKRYLFLKMNHCHIFGLLLNSVCNFVLMLKVLCLFLLASFYKPQGTLCLNHNTTTSLCSEEAA